MEDPKADVPGPSNHNQGGNADANAANAINGFENGSSSVHMFKEICGVDEETAVQLLRESGGNLEAAIHQFFFTRDNPEVLENQNNADQELRQRRQPPPVVDNQNAPELRNELIPQRAPSTWGGWLRALVMLPLRFMFSSLTDLLTFFYNTIVGPPGPPRIPGRDRNFRAIQPNPQNVIADRNLMREQQNQYEQALAIDRQKAQERKLQEQQRQEEAQRAREETERLQARSARLRAKREEIANRIGQDAPSPDEQGGIVRIRISFPDGTKVERRFRQEDSLTRLFDAVFVQPECPENFSLLISYPSTLLRCTPDWYRREFEGGTIAELTAEMPVKTFAEQGLLNSAVILVQDNDA